MDALGNKTNFSNASQKIAKTKLGLITGAGSSILLNSVNKNLEEIETRHTDEILNIIKKEKSRLFNLYNFLNLDLYKKTIESTGWIFTYITLNNNNPLLRLGIYHPSLGEEIGFYAENYPAVIFPFEASSQEASELSLALKSLVKPANDFGGISDCIQYHIESIGSFIDFIAPSYASISSSSQFAVHGPEGMWISPIIKPREAVQLTIKFEF